MTTALALIDFTRDQIELIKRTICVGATDDELQLFVMQAKRMGLDPFSRQIHAVKRPSKNLETGNYEQKMAIQVGIDGYRLVADRTGRYAPGKASTFDYNPTTNKLDSATAYVMKFVGNQWIECSAIAHMEEYAQTKKDGSYTQMWATKPHIMLAKCAEALALRRAFPAELSGVYTDDEMPEAAHEVAITKHEPAKIVDQTTGEIVEPKQIAKPEPTTSGHDKMATARERIVKYAKALEPYKTQTNVELRLVYARACYTNKNASMDTLFKEGDNLKALLAACAQPMPEAMAIPAVDQSKSGAYA